MKPLLLTLCCLISSSLFLQAQDNSPSPIIFIYDASGSMWGQMEGKTKMQIAGKVLSEALDNLPEQQQIGLVAYGHRRKKDCEDVEILVEMDNADKQTVQESIGNIKPLGRTPLAYSAEQVINQLRTSGKKATIILITDGIESCNGDLCAVIKAAKAEGIEFKLHIIGFGLKDGETEALKCAADAGDGKYYDAADAGSLEVGIEEATVATIDTVKYEAPIKPEKNFSAFVFKNGEPVDAWVKAYPVGKNNYTNALRTYADTGFMALEPGIYDMKFQPLGGSDVAATTLKQVEVFADSIVHRTMSFDAGKLEVTALVNGDPTDASVYVYVQGTKKSTGGGRTYKRTMTNELDPGVYDIVIKSLKVSGASAEHRIEGVEIKANETTTVNHNFKSGTITVSATNNGEGWDATVYIYSTKTKKSTGGGRTYKKESTSEITPGLYDVTIKALKISGIHYEKIFKDVLVSADSLTSISHDFETGVLSVGAKSNGNLIDATVSIYEVTQRKSCGGGRTYTSPKSNPKASMLNPGTYEVTVKALKEFRGKKEVFTVEVKKGDDITRIIEF